MTRIWIIFCCFCPFLFGNITGCGSVSKSMESWVGHDVDELTTSWGMPQQIMHNENGGLIYVYHRSEELVRFKPVSPEEKDEQEQSRYNTGNKDNTPNITGTTNNTNAPEESASEIKTYRSVRSFFQ